VAEELEPKRALDRARESLEGGAARRVLETWKRIAMARRPSAGS
jgi:hypothetical protein